MKFIRTLFKHSIAIYCMCITKTNHLILYIVRIIREKLSTISSLGKMPVGGSNQQALCFWTSSYKITKKEKCFRIGRYKRWLSYGGYRTQNETPLREYSVCTYHETMLVQTVRLREREAVNRIYALEKNRLLQIGFICDFRLPPRFRPDLRSSRILRGVWW